MNRMIAIMQLLSSTSDGVPDLGVLSFNRRSRVHISRRKHRIMLETGTNLCNLSYTFS
jgi:hypothetical protein